jgi:2-polyprenyl-6-methoxyphenol hydroxylase-like FAD-dependent oxidoreductase
VNADGAALSIHESGHAASILLIPKWKLVGVVRTSAGGRTLAIPRAADPDDNDEIVEIGIEAATQLSSPLLLGADGIRGDLRRLAQLERLSIPVCEGITRAKRLNRTEEHRELRNLIAKRMMECPDIIFDPPIEMPEDLFEILR